MYELIIVIMLNSKIIISESLMIPEEKDCQLAEADARKKAFLKYGARYKNMRVDGICVQTQFENEEEGEE